MTERCGRASGFAAVVAIAVALWAGGAEAEINAHRALYTMTLGTSRTDSGVTGAHGAMAYQWGETCEGWTVEQRYKLTLSYAESQDVVIVSNFVTWESKDGLRYRFNQKETRNGTVDEEIRGEAQLDGPGKGGTITFEKPNAQTMKLPPGALFPSAHTILLLEKARAGENFVSRQVFDGATVEGAVLVTAAIGSKVEPDPKDPLKAPILQHAGWRVRLAFFPAEVTEEKPDYELGMLLLENGVSRDMLIDYGDYTIKAKLDSIEPLPKPTC
ncbi:MAG TPA: cell envelope integrity EipB family protein [Stellaceae bacterium]|nr:cell envelope integrity EipB family protein [Stellaceae bacterium]